ncbi:translation initiation factor IF-2-like [Rhinolophus ferrumequinum]|uniref:translation initiation factor IF-2-like n=1 Tax=Rhinolophus ferrumequinum TaxID=59479 RepID=UPI00140F61DA|nr:translation initiation factor IF-2-like [Rhinolophus ferrumequinum]
MARERIFCFQLRLLVLCVHLAQLRSRPTPKGVSTGGRESRRSWSPTFVHLGARSASPGLLAELWLQRVPESPCFLTDISRQSPPQPRACGFGGSVRLNCRPSCPSRLRGGPRARPARPKESPGSGGSGGSEPWYAPAMRRGLLRGQAPGLGGSVGRARGHRAVTGLPRGLCSPLWPHCALPSSPQPAPVPSLRAGPVCFLSLARAPGTRQQPSERRPRREAVARGRPRSAGPAGSEVRGDGALEPFWGSGGRGGGLTGRTAGEGPSPGLRRARAACATAHPTARGPRAPGPGPQPQPCRRVAAVWNWMRSP